MPFDIERLAIQEVVLIRPRVFNDDRGFFMETYRQTVFSNSGIKDVFTQDNHSLSKKGVLRGLHYQLPPMAQAKLVRVVNGAVWDVAVDIRRQSPSFGRWVATELNDENRAMLFIPEGFAHGFLVLSDTAEFVYKCSREYAPEHEAGIYWNDVEISIRWPGSGFLVSEKDNDLPLLKNARLFD